MKIINEKESIEENINRIRKEVINLKDKIEEIDYYKIFKEIKPENYNYVIEEMFLKVAVDYYSDISMLNTLENMFKIYEFYHRYKEIIKGIYEDLDVFFDKFENFKREEDEEGLYVNMNYEEDIILNKYFFEKIKFNYNLSKKLPSKDNKFKRGKI